MRNKFSIGEQTVSMSFSVTPEQRAFIDKTIMKVDAIKKGNALFRLCHHYAKSVEGIDFTPTQETYKRIIGDIKPDDIIIREINLKLAKKLVTKYHYSHTWPNTSIVLGFYFRSKLLGIVCYGVGANKNLIPSVCKGVKPDEGFELVRLFAFDWAPKNIESYMIAQSFKHIQQNYPKIKVLVSFADPKQGHLGIIYQATNWLYTGKSKDEFFFKFSGKLVHPRTVSNYSKEMRKRIRNPKNRVLVGGKHRYVYLLGSKKQRKILKSSLKHPILPYPKTKEKVKRL